MTTLRITAFNWLAGGLAVLLCLSLGCSGSPSPSGAGGAVPDIGTTPRNDSHIGTTSAEGWVEPNEIPPAVREARDRQPDAPEPGTQLEVLTGEGPVTVKNLGESVEDVYDDKSYPRPRKREHDN